MTIKPEWTELSSSLEVMVNTDGKIVAEVRRTADRLTWLFQGFRYLTKEQAKRAAERFMTYEEPL